MTKISVRGTRAGRKRLVFPVLGVLLLASIVLGVMLGAVHISPAAMGKMLLNKTSLFHFQPAWAPGQEDILFAIRLPRVVAGALVGAALAGAGVIFQGLLRNPLADPYVIGTAAGAGLGAAIAMILPFQLLFAGFGLVALFAFVGALLAVMLVYRISRVGGKTPVLNLLLAGFAVSSLFGAAIGLLMYTKDRLHLKLPQVYSFMMGGISVTGWKQIIIAAPLIIGGLVLARSVAFHLNAFSVGEEGASYLGINVEKEKVVLLGIGALLTAAAVSLAGLVGFVGLIVPHAVRLMIGPDHRLLLPASALAGSTFLVLADLLARTVLAPSEIPVGILTAIIGAPFFLYLLRRNRSGYAF